MRGDSVLDALHAAASEQAEAICVTARDWRRAKDADEHQPGRIYGQRLIAACWELHETVERIRSEEPDPDRKKQLTQQLGVYRSELGAVDRDGLYFAARATWHRADAVAGGQTARYFGGASVTSSTATVHRMDFAGWAAVEEDSEDWHAAYVVKDVTITLVGQNPKRQVKIAGDAACDAAYHLIDAVGWILEAG